MFSNNRTNSTEVQELMSLNSTAVADEEQKEYWKDRNFRNLKRRVGRQCDDDLQKLVDNFPKKSAKPSTSCSSSLWAQCCGPRSGRRLAEEIIETRFKDFEIEFAPD